MDDKVNKQPGILFGSPASREAAKATYEPLARAVVGKAVLAFTTGPLAALLIRRVAIETQKAIAGMAREHQGRAVAASLFTNPHFTKGDKEQWHDQIRDQITELELDTVM